jgi:PAS domain S-box-containing protein
LFSFFYECEEKYQHMMDFAPHMIASINHDGQILDCNSRIFEILGYCKE